MILRPLAPEDAAELRRIRATPEVARWFEPPAANFPWSDEPEATRLVIEVDGAVAGLIAIGEEPSPGFRHANISIFLDPARHGHGIGTEALRQVIRHLIEERGHHRITIDPATENKAAIRAYEKAGFRPVGVMRRAERDADGSGWHDVLMMEYVVEEDLPVSEEREGLTFTLKREMPASPERVWQVLTEPGELAKWWGPAGFSTPAIELDLRVGGAYRFKMQPPEGDPFYLQGEFTEVDPPNRLAYTFRWEDPDPDDQETVATLTLRDLGETTELTLEQGPFATEARRELHHDGWSDGFEKIAELLSSPS
jgi:uncharacterized protein YndB with AHSA1/START domain/RimJ/RimL family protein N-acetyltransferase